MLVPLVLFYAYLRVNVFCKNFLFSEWSLYLLALFNLLLTFAASWIHLHNNDDHAWLEWSALRPALRLLDWLFLANILHRCVISAPQLTPPLLGFADFFEEMHVTSAGLHLLTLLVEEGLLRRQGLNNFWFQASRFFADQTVMLLTLSLWITDCGFAVAANVAVVPDHGDPDFMESLWGSYLITINDEPDAVLVCVPKRNEVYGTRRNHVTNIIGTDFWLPMGCARRRQDLPKWIRIAINRTAVQPA